MKLPPVEYEAPTTVAEAIDLLAERLTRRVCSPAAKLDTAGATSCWPTPAICIDIDGIDELSGVSAADGWVAVGAMTREYVAEDSETVAECRAVAGGGAAHDRS